MKPHRAGVVALGRHAHVAQQLEHGAHILQARHIAQGHGLVGQQGRTQLGQRGVLGAGDDHLAAEPAPAANQQFVHWKFRAGSMPPVAGNYFFSAAHSAGV